MEQVSNQDLERAGSARTIPSLDGLRAFSILLVIFAHAQGTHGFPSWIPQAVADHGSLGVQIFFVISGFLITSLLIGEQTATGSISLGLFYARRTLRIFPPLYLYIAVLALATWIGILHVPPLKFLLAATYTMNYAPLSLWVTNHLWSLSVEEQFYLVWPFLIKLRGLRQALWIAFFVAVFGPLTCFGVYLINPHIGGSITMFFPFVENGIAAGCVLAGILPWLRRQPLFKWFGTPSGDLVIPLVLLLDLGRNHPRVHLGFSETALNVCICYALVRYTEFPGGFAGRILNNQGVTFIGRLSYSLYLWQQIFMNPTDLRQTFPINVAASFGCAFVSYFFVERPLAGMRKRLHPTGFLRRPSRTDQITERPSSSLENSFENC